MARVKCSKCGALAHCVIDKKTYCLDCAPNPEKVERPAPWPEEPEVVKEMEIVKITNTTLKDYIEKKPWWKRLLGI